jgi:hypothetical protein
MTPEDVICVLQAGAVDAIRKGVLKKKEVLARLARAQDVGRFKLNLNLTNYAPKMDAYHNYHESRNKLCP